MRERWMIVMTRLLERKGKRMIVFPLFLDHLNIWNNTQNQWNTNMEVSEMNKWQTSQWMERTEKDQSNDLLIEVINLHQQSTGVRGRQFVCENRDETYCNDKSNEIEQRWKWFWSNPNIHYVKSIAKTKSGEERNNVFESNSKCHFSFIFYLFIRLNTTIEKIFCIYNII